MNRLPRILLVAAVALLAGGLFTACQPPTGPRVVIFGDSLTIESKGSGDAASILSGYRLDWSGTKYMTSPCNGIAYAKKLTYVPDFVIINYGGNSGSYQENCMNGEHGQALADRYRADITTLIGRFRNGTTKIVVVGAPTRKPTQADTNLVFTTEKAVAADPANGVGFFDGGRFITPNRTSTSRFAACLSPRETGSRCGTSGTAGKNYIRDAWHEHLCPNGGQIDGSCTVYSSGAVRLTLNFRDGLKVAKVAKR
jgi:hypothetical protein